MLSLITDQAQLITADNRVDWLENRRQGIGGSDAAPIVGHTTQYTSALAIYRDKLLPVADDQIDEMSDACLLGTLWERPLAEAFAKKYGAELAFDPEFSLWQSSELPFMQVSLDGVILSHPMRDEADGPGVLEIKTMGDQVFDCPLHFQIQVQHAMAVTGMRWGVVFILSLAFGRRTLTAFMIERDESFINTLIEQERDFWHNNVLAEVEPEATGHECDFSALKDLYPQDNGEIVELPEAVDTIVAKRSVLIAEIKDRETQVDAIKNGLRQLMGDNQEGRTPMGHKVRWKNGKRARTLTVVEAK